MLNESPGIGIDYRTGQLIDGWAHVVQSLEILFSTRYGERVMREYVGSLIPTLLGQNLTARTVNRTKMAMWVAIETFEPRYRITQITSLDVSRTGRYGLELSGVYRPRAHLGDFTADGSRKLRVGATADRAVTFEPL
jgi:phage baseplate assembly protein W